MPATPSPISAADRTTGAAASRALALLLCVSVVPWAAAQTTDEAETSAPVLEEVTVTATRQEESLSRVPISVSVETRDGMDFKGIKDFSDVVRFTPGVAFDADETNRISIRGISRFI